MANPDIAMTQPLLVSPPLGALAFDPVARAFLARTKPVAGLCNDLRELATTSLELALIRAADKLDTR